jgi:chromate reductase, NAD(P)H dehydrogenase (quinone)
MDRMKHADAVVISSPEYNFSIPGTLKNLIDWVSRENPMPWKGVRMLLMSASPSLVGGNRGLWATRVPLECCGAIVHPDMFSLASAYEAFDAQGNLKDQALSNRLKATVQTFTQFVETLN